MTGNGALKIEKDGYVAWVTMNRPEKRNTFTMDMFNAFIDVFPRLDDDPDVRVVVIKGEGKSFTAGLDLMEAGSLFEPTPGADSRERARKHLLHLQESMNVIERCRKPVIAAAHSHCIGMGVDLLSACDIRLASRDAVFSIRETRIAIIADLGTLQRLPYIVGHGWARELALTGRDFSAEEALKMGFITHLCENREDLYRKAGEIAGEIAENSPLAVQGAKDVMMYSRDNGVRAGLDYVVQKNVAVLPCEDLTEAFQAFMEKRKPVFKGK
ncbi:MAG: crotonase/enoyl-CoA hydratase family protein [Candidatus Abyssobacteria bacterium SURF_5]|uniref:Crotonase/enoyl-CoA hydratase family protein n=1 Tax=Abyssobacteria bacterium (strain SURF_5) TaxID=2093360 RepID=A0A3A4NX78_ABYX5|nr:MAG: crotonase/enoyl-CoA hydratase family protein [Candidatus Abyssubacteria bacterium SURF_5]